MAGIQADRGDTSHRIVSGEVPVVGLRVMTNEYRWATIVALAPEREMEQPCGWYCPAWHEVEYEDGRLIRMNCDRLTTREPKGW